MRGWPRPDEPSGQITLVLDQRSTLDPGDDLRDGLSAIARQGPHLWVANDETTSVERLTLEDGDRARAHRSFDLTNVLELPGDTGELDIEGLDIEADTLWLLGSHSSARKQVKDKSTPAEAQRSLATVEVSQRRRVLARVPTAVLLDPGGRTRQQQPAAVLGLGRSEDLVELLSDDPHLGVYIQASKTGVHPIPGKENGIDCEGLAVAGRRVFIGLRGPVLRGWAMIIELTVGDGPGIEPQPIGPGNRRYRKHFLHLDGLGVRDLCRHGDDLLVLAGPTMELDGRTPVFRWRNALTSQAEAVLRKDDLPCEFDAPFGRGDDHAEGITVLDDGRSALVLYGTPAGQRKTGRHEITADVFHLSP
ncbi:DUF3616 domain-containing protein [Arthrobacter sp. NicSoilB8]|uniref:DUF3616 domain-containing protein n=1 Tax=Arthrobacter sp. NicSoilB8 TaxID=2830998 RepID=UPI001CC4E459|nr:DUF3616 domain-containing protein [Arthrobacter sp. NicSoilB8]BCW71010.1 hypothetical protein NicSoilB8_20540 [Arthrobacter sp. NicSoilB8]